MFDLSEEKGSHFITMEYVSGGDLKKFIRRAKRLDSGTAISVTKQICDGLEEAHSLSIVHRDLKPSNIMIDDNGNARIMDFGIARTVKGFKRALELNPNYATALHWYGVFYLWPMGRLEEAMRAIKRSQELDPLSPIINSSIGSILYYSKKYDQAIEVFQNVLAMEPNFPPASLSLHYAYIKKGMYDKAIQHGIKASYFWGGWDEKTIDEIEDTYAQLGFKAAIQKILEANKDPMNRAQYYAVLGKKDEAFECLVQAYEQRIPPLIYLKTDPLLENLRSDPRFKAIMQKMNLE